LNWLRAGVLGALDGIISIAAIILGVSAGSDNIRFLILSAVSALVAGSLSMAFGEYLSVSSQTDSYQADIKKEIDEHNKGPEARRRELDELVDIYIERGLSPTLARTVAIELSKDDPVRAHVRDELGINVHDFVSPFQAAFSSCIAFFLGGLLPALTLFIPNSLSRMITLVCVSEFLFVVIALTSCRLGAGNGYLGVIFRLLVGGSLALGITYGAGKITSLI